MSDSRQLFHYAGALLGTAVIYSALKLILPIVYPTIITYPWEERDEHDKVACLAGSFNPPHHGHLAMMEYLSRRFKKLIVVVGVNPDKQYKVSGQERVDVLQKMVSDKGLKNVKVQVVEGLIWRTVKPMGVNVFIRGIRSWDRDGPDERKLQILNTWGPLLLGPLWWPLPTVFLAGKPQFNHVSSTLIRDICQSPTQLRGGALKQLIPECVTDDIQALYYE